MENSSPPWSAYRALMACRLGALYKSPGICPLGIGEMLCRSIYNIVMKEIGDHAKTACGSLQMCAGIKFSIEGETHSVAQRQQERIAPT